MRRNFDQMLLNRYEHEISYFVKLTMEVLWYESIHIYFDIYIYIYINLFAPTILCNIDY